MLQATFFIRKKINSDKVAVNATMILEISQSPLKIYEVMSHLYFGNYEGKER